MTLSAKSSLILPWNKAAFPREGHNFIKYGFPLGCLGPESNTADIPNYDTAVNFPSFLHDFIREEIREEAFLGPFPEVPFFPWAHTSPIITHPKSDPTKRPVITDLTFPQSHSVNAYIIIRNTGRDFRGDVYSPPPLIVTEPEG